jgi:hypothetical protein
VTLFEVSRRTTAASRAPRIPHAVAIGGAFAAAVAVVAIVAAAMAIDGWLTTARDGSPSPTGPAAASTSPSAVGALPSSGALIDPDAPFPTAEEERLLALLVESDRERCHRAAAADRPIYTVVFTGGVFGDGTERLPVPYAAAIDCALGGITAPDRLLYWDLRPALGGRSLFQTGDASALVFQQAGRVGAAERPCAEGVPAHEAWSFGGASGDLVCYETLTGDAVLLWSRDDSPLLGKAVRDDRNMADLLAWWHDVARFHD